MTSSFERHESEALMSLLASRHKAKIPGDWFGLRVRSCRTEVVLYHSSPGSGSK